MVRGRSFIAGVSLWRNMGSRYEFRSKCARRVPDVDAARCIWEYVVCTRRIHFAGVFRSVANTKTARIQFS
jgi:hypothetical protein